MLPTQWRTGPIRREPDRRNFAGALTETTGRDVPNTIAGVIARRPSRACLKGCSTLDAGRSTSTAPATSAEAGLRAQLVGTVGDAVTLPAVQARLERG